MPVPRLAEHLLLGHRPAVEVLGPEIRRRRLHLGGRQAAQLLKVLLHPVEIADVDGDLDQTPQRPLDVGAHVGLVGLVQDLSEAAARSEVVARVEEAVAQEEKRIGRRGVPRVVVDDVGEDDAGAEVVLQSVEELTIGEPLFDVGRATDVLRPQGLPLHRLEVALDVRQLAGQRTQVLRLADRRETRTEREGSEQDPAADAEGKGGHSSSPELAEAAARPRSRTCSMYRMAGRSSSGAVGPPFS